MFGAYPSVRGLVLLKIETFIIWSFHSRKLAMVSGHKTSFLLCIRCYDHSCSISIVGPLNKYYIVCRILQMNMLTVVAVISVQAQRK